MKEQDVEARVRAKLFALQDTAYRDFQCKLTPSIKPETVIGVRAPAIRTIAKEYAKSPDAAVFLSALPHAYYEENNLHAALIGGIKDYGACVAAVDAFLPYVDNWATCDSLKPAVFKKRLDVLPREIERWLSSSHTYTIRFGVEMLMNHYLDAAFDESYLARVAALRSEEYYVNMMIAWYFATALAKQYDAALPYIEGRRLGAWTHNKAIQKAIESYRVTEEQKAYLRTRKIKTEKTGRIEET